MKRSTPLRRTSSLRTTSTLTRRTRISPRSKTNSYRKRPRDSVYMLWVKTLPCMVRELPPHIFTNGDASAPPSLQDIVALLRTCAAMIVATTPCSGPVEADHMGARGMGQKADDRTCVPMCQSHHRARHDHSRDFRPLTRDELRAWRAAAIERTQAAWENR